MVRRGAATRRGAERAGHRLRRCARDGAERGLGGRGGHHVERDLLHQRAADHRAEVRRLGAAAQGEGAVFPAIAGDAARLLGLEGAPVGGEGQARGGGDEARGEAVDGAAVLDAARVLLGEARAVVEVFRLHQAALGSDGEGESALAHGAEDLAGAGQPLLGAGDLQLAVERLQQRVRGLEGGLAAHGPALAGEGVGDGLVEEERVVVALVGDELIAEAEEAAAFERARAAGEGAHAILRSSARSRPRISSTADSISTIASGPRASG